MDLFNTYNKIHNIFYSLILKLYFILIESSGPKLKWLRNRERISDAIMKINNQFEQADDFFLWRKSSYLQTVTLLCNYVDCAIEEISRSRFTDILYCVEKQLFLRTIYSELKIWWTTGFSITMQPVWKLLINSNNVLLCLNSIDRKS